jgi:uncharacterized protein YndB with AHSA1/START domain
MTEMIKYELEYTFKTTPKVLYSRLATASGLAEWFADDVKVNNNILTFIWNGSQQQAEVLMKKDNDCAKYRWLDYDEDTYFEFKINQDELTGDIALIITDFADDEEVKEEDIELWDTQIQELKRILGL